MGEFLSWHRQLERQPRISNVWEYGNSWTAWHGELKAGYGYCDMVKGGGNGIFLVVLTLRWWADVTDELEDGNVKEWSNSRLGVAMRELEESMTGVLESSTLYRVLQGLHSKDEDSAPEYRHPRKR